MISVIKNEPAEIFGIKNNNNDSIIWLESDYSIADIMNKAFNEAGCDTSIVSFRRIK